MSPVSWNVMSSLRFAQFKNVQRPGAMAYACCTGTWGNLMQEDHLNPGVGDQPEKQSETSSQNKTTKPTKMWRKMLKKTEALKGRERWGK
jgi:hypothetical protein